MGKLMILKLRDDYKAKQGASYTLEEFHDSFLVARPAPAHSAGNAGAGRRAVPCALGTNRPPIARRISLPGASDDLKVTAENSHRSPL